MNQLISMACYPRSSIRRSVCLALVSWINLLRNAGVGLRGFSAIVARIASDRSDGMSILLLSTLCQLEHVAVMAHTSPPAGALRRHQLC